MFWKKRQMKSIWFLQVLSKSSWTNSKLIFKTLSALGACHVTIIGGIVYKRSMIFEVFESNLGKFLIFLREIVLVARSCLVVVINIKILIIDALVTLEASLKVPILAVFLRFLASFELFFSALAYGLAQWFFHKRK